MSTSITPSFDTSVYLLINNQFDITTRLDTFSIKAFDIQRVIDRFVDKLDQQSSYLVKGDVRTHFSKMMDNIVDYSIWDGSSDVWKYLGTPLPEVCIKCIMQSRNFEIVSLLFSSHLIVFSSSHSIDSYSCIHWGFNPSTPLLWPYPYSRCQWTTCYSR